MAVRLCACLLTGLMALQELDAPGNVGPPEDVGPLQGVGSPEEPHSAETVTGKMRERLDGVRSLAARYTVTSYAAVLESRSETEGNLYLQRDRNRLRLEEAGQTIVSDGETLWTYVPGNRQVIVSPAAETTASTRPDEFLFNYSNRYRYDLEGRQKIEDSSYYILKLTAIEPAEIIPELRIWVDDDTWLTKKVAYTDDMGSETTLRFMDYRLNEKLAPGLFEMTAPEGVEWVDLR